MEGQKPDIGVLWAAVLHDVRGGPTDEDGGVPGGDQGGLDPARGGPRGLQS